MTPALPTQDDIVAARSRLSGVAVRTPLLEAPQMNAMAGRRVLVKAECLQRTGSFKFRGAWNFIASLEPDLRARGVVAFSSGNHGQAVACAARMHDIAAVIVMPSDAPATKIEATRRYGAEVILYDRDREDREAIGAEISGTRGMSLIRPFDDALIIAGQGSCGAEIAEQAKARGIGPFEMLVCCSGGGLAAGIALALERAAPGARVHPVEPEGFDDFARSLQRNTPARNDRASGSIQDALLTPTPGRLTLPIGRRLFSDGIAVTDDQALRAMALAWEGLKIVLEPGGAAALAAALFHGESLALDTVIVTASGGNVDREIFLQALSAG